MTEILPGELTHTDIIIDYEQRLKDAGATSDEIESKTKLYRLQYARMALGVYHPTLDKEHQDATSMHLTHVVEAEASRRGAHYHRYRLMTQAGVRGMLLDGPDSSLPLPEQALLELKGRIAGLTEDAYDLAKNLYGGKGISAELGHVDQLGDWDAVRPLDSAIRALPDSAALQDSGFVFDNKFDSKVQAKIDYGFNIAGRLHSPSTIAKRKRAAADIHAVNEKGENAGSYEIVKQSTFLITDKELSSSSQALISKIKRLAGISKPTNNEKQELDHAMQEAGMKIVEPLIGDRDAREKQAGVIAATSVYFALHRHR